MNDAISFSHSNSALTSTPVHERARFDHVLTAHARTFAFASRFLPADRRKGVTVLYAFCRTMDDLADELPAAVGLPALDDWHRWLSDLERGQDCGPPSQLPSQLGIDASALASALRDTVEEHNIPVKYLRMLVEGVRLDATRTRVRDFTELRAFCYAAAGTVGLAMCYVLGTESAEALRRAERLGIAMQLTNVLRDVGEDWERGRTYLPADEMQLFNVSDEHLASRCVDAQFIALMRFQIERARRYYAAGLPGVFLLPANCRLPILVAGRLYRAILGRIEAQKHDVFSRRASTSTVEKLGELARASLSLHLTR